MNNKSEFASNTLNHLQSLITFMDVKTGLLLTVGAILTASFFVVVGEVSSGCSPLLFYLLIFSYLASFIVTTILLLNVITPRIGKTKESTFTGLIFFRDILESKHEVDFRTKFQNASEEFLIEDYSNNIYALARVLNAKMSRLRHGIKALKITIFMWLISILVFIFLT